MEDPANSALDRGLGPDPETVFTVLVVLPGGLGRVLKGIPALRHLRALYEQARIKVAVERVAFDLLAACPFVDECTDIERPGELLLERFDVVVSLADPAEPANLFSGLGALHARAHAAYRLPTQPAAHAVHPVRLHRSTASARMLHLAWLLGGDRVSGDIALWPRLADRNTAADLLEVTNGPVAIIHQGASDTRRQWPVADFARVATMVHALGLTPVVVGLPADAAANAELATLASVPVLDLTGLTNVGVLAGLMERAALFVGVDSGPAVLAGATGTRSVVIGPGCPVEQSGPVARTTYLAAEVVGVLSGDRLPDAHEVRSERALAAVTLAASQAARHWRANHLAS